MAGMALGACEESPAVRPVGSWLPVGLQHQLKMKGEEKAEDLCNG